MLPQVESIYSIDTKSQIKRVLEAGITTSYCSGSGNVIGGLVCAVKPMELYEEMCIKN